MEAATKTDNGNIGATTSMPIIRRATTQDIEQIHCAHMKSIRQCCTKEYSPEQIEAWGGRPLNVELWTDRICNHFVVVLEQDGVVEGFADAHYPNPAQSTVCELLGFYFTPAVRGKGFGREIVRRLVERARQLGMTKMLVKGSLTSAAFYRRVGFRQSSPSGIIEVNGIGIPYLQFELEV